jgi:hypothetical protein
VRGTGACAWPLQARVGIFLYLTYKIRLIRVKCRESAGPCLQVTWEGLGRLTGLTRLRDLSCGEAAPPPGLPAVLSRLTHLRLGGELLKPYKTLTHLLKYLRLGGKLPDNHGSQARLPSPA